VTGLRPWHRARQFFGALRPRVSPDERAAAYEWLSASLRAVFESMTLRDQQHGIIVWRRVRAASVRPDADLFAAALIHDCGKGRVALWHRVAHVLLASIAPPLERRVAAEHGVGWRRALWRLREHPRLGAEMAAAAGASAGVVRLIAEQDSPNPDVRLAILQQADDA
jgi:hypothetical protein